ncbi:MAG: UDP-glucose--hexose-1-phosphate uridylyltransferase [Chloroflexi bacterium]|nr:UDP-glucose--hexose-1-phosphate uridylyltransferase [Chloroflexota bacterium]
MPELDLQEHPHRRYNPLTGEWVLVSPHRTKRPWQGKVEKTAPEDKPHYDPTCYLCPGNTRAGGVETPHYSGTYVFTNDYAALLEETPSAQYERGLLLARSERGLCRVLCFTPRHDLTLAEMDAADIRPIVDAWVEQYAEIGAKPHIHYVQIFENKGAMMGASSPHPHGQIWANETLPNEILKEHASQQAYWQSQRRCLLCDYVQTELAIGERIVTQNAHFVAVVPFWAIWPFETMVLSKRHMTSLLDLQEAERDALADIVQRVTARYDNLFETSFPYSMGFHQKPTDGGAHEAWHLHLHFYPPLLRSATVRKFMVGYEMLATPQRDITAESSAARLRALSEVHYRRVA